MLQGVLERRYGPLTYDGRQWYSQLYEECMANEGEAVAPWLEMAKKPPRLSLMPRLKTPLLAGDGQHGPVNHIVRIPDNPHHVVSVSTANQELCVWNIITLVYIFTWLNGHFSLLSQSTKHRKNNVTVRFVKNA